MCKYIHIKYACLWPGPKLHKELCECYIRLFRIFLPHTLLPLPLTPTPSVNPYLNILKKKRHLCLYKDHVKKINWKVSTLKAKDFLIYYFFYSILFCFIYQLPVACIICLVSLYVFPSPDPAVSQSEQAVISFFLQWGSG